MIQFRIQLTLVANGQFQCALEFSPSYPYYSPPVSSRAAKIVKFGKEER